MPNGGTDNCMNCPHNRANHTPINIKTALRRTRVPFCTVHQIPVWDHAWTYCSNYAKEEPNIYSPIYASGLYESGYARIPWLGFAEPVRNFAVTKCETCGNSTESGLLMEVPELEVRAEFCCNDHYHHWWQEQYNNEHGVHHWHVYDRSPLQEALLSPNKLGVNKLIEQYASINHQDRAGWTALHLAAFLGLDSVVDMLISAGADVTLKDAAGLKAIDLAGSEGHSKIVGKLAGTSFGDQESKEAALLSAAAGGNLEIVEALVNDGVNIECRDYRGRTPLLLAIWENHYTTSVFLLDHGANVRAEDKFGETPRSTVDTWNNQTFTELRRLVHEWLAQ